MADEQAAQTPESHQQKLIEQYELPDSNFDPDIDSVIPPAAPAAPEAPAAPARDPESGKFVAAPKKHDHSRALARRAAELGLSEEDIAETPADDLRVLVGSLSADRAHNSLSRQADQYRGANDPAGDPAGDPARDPARTPPGGDEPFAVELSDGYDDDLRAAIHKIVAEVNSLRALKSEVGRVQSFQHAQVRDTLAARADRVFAKHAVMGTGGRDDLARDSAEYQRRVAVLSAVERDRSPGSLEAKIERHVELLFGATRPAPEPQNGEAGRKRITEGQWDEAGLAPPTNRLGELPKGDKRAQRAVASMLRQKGVATDDDFGGTEAANLPD